MSGDQVDGGACWRELETKRREAEQAKQAREVPGCESDQQRPVTLTKDARQEKMTTRRLKPGGVRPAIRRLLRKGCDDWAPKENSLGKRSVRRK